MIIVQRIKTKWSKASRGGNAAGIRNAVPESLLIPFPESAADYLLHDIHATEDNDFQCDETVVESGFKKHIRLDPLILNCEKEFVTVDFLWSREHCGAPERDSHRVLKIALNQWGRFSCNGRFHLDWDTSEWTYEKNVFNIAFVSDLNVQIFLESMPHAEASKMATLR